MFQCKHRDTEETKPSCQEDIYSGTWVFIRNKGQVNEYKDTLKLSWTGSTYLINNSNSTKEVYANYIKFSNTKSIEINKPDCNLTSSGISGYKL